MLFIANFYSGFITEAVHRYYESRRRLFNDTKPGRAEKAQETKIKTKKQQLRNRVSSVLSVLQHIFIIIIINIAVHATKEVFEEGKGKK